MLTIFKKDIIGRLNQQADESVGPYNQQLMICYMACTCIFKRIIGFLVATSDSMVVVLKITNQHINTAT
jgi:hypothetical protein